MGRRTFLSLGHRTFLSLVINPSGGPVAVNAKYVITFTRPLDSFRFKGVDPVARGIYDDLLLGYRSCTEAVLIYRHKSQTLVWAYQNSFNPIAFMGVRVRGEEDLL